MLISGHGRSPRGHVLLGSRKPYLACPQCSSLIPPAACWGDFVQLARSRLLTVSTIDEERSFVQLALASANDYSIASPFIESCPHTHCVVTAVSRRRSGILYSGTFRSEHQVVQQVVS
jgi:hypothetical protein